MKTAEAFGAKQCVRRPSLCEISQPVCVSAVHGAVVRTEKCLYFTLWPLFRVYCISSDSMVQVEAKMLSTCRIKPVGQFRQERDRSRGCPEPVHLHIQPRNGPRASSAQDCDTSPHKVEHSTVQAQSKLPAVRGSAGTSTVCC